jgi:hypothetical protein
MLYVHAFSAVEQQLFKQLSNTQSLTQMDIMSIENHESVGRILNFGNHRILLYSFQRLEYYKYLDTFQFEINQVKILAKHIKQAGFEKIILISSPGAYASSDNLYLQHKGLIEQLFVGTDIPCTILRVQGICSPPLQINNFHHLFYQAESNQYVVPKKNGNVVYSVKLNHLATIIQQACIKSEAQHFDVFDNITSLKNFLQYNSPQLQVLGLPIFYLYFQSYIGKYMPPAMFELFVRSGVPMYNFRTEKVFQVSLNADMFNDLTTGMKRGKDSDFIFSKKGQLIPVS